MTTLLKNCRIYDGTGEAGYYGYILLEDEKIAAVGCGDPELSAEEVIDLEGLSVSPGWIDGHSHNDWFAVKKQPLPFFEPFIRQGITTYVTGNCGLSAVGFEEHADLMGGGLFHYQDTTGVYGDTAAFLQAVDGGCPGNIAVLAGHCSARASVAGYENRRLTQEEESRMLQILEKALQEGAAGISLGLMYEPGLYAQLEELKKVAALCVKYDRPLTIHPRAESAVSMSYPELLGRSHLLRALDEIAEIARGTKLKLQYSHAIFVGRRSFKDREEFLRIMEGLRQEGVDAAFDIYNETLGVSVITVILPAWYQSMTPAQKKNPLTKLKLAVLVKASSLLLGFGFDDIQVAYIGEGYEHYEGKTVHQLAKEAGKSDLQMYLELCEKSNYQGRVNMGPYSTPEILSQFSRHPNCTFMTDAWVEEHGVQNPACYDCYPKFVRDALLGTGAELPAAIRKMSGAVADRFRLENRGYIKPGCYADLTIFDEEAMKQAVPDQGKAFGVRQVYLNGHRILKDGELTAGNFGHAIAVK